MPNTAINRDKVHALAEACSDQGDAFQPVATRLIKNQRRLSASSNRTSRDGSTAVQVGLYMLSVSLRISSDRWTPVEGQRRRHRFRDRKGPGCSGRALPGR